MAATAPKVSWIARQWKTGWEKIPLVMTAHCLTVPLLIMYIGVNLLPTGHKFRIFDSQPEKYRSQFTIMRSDDPRVAKINKYSKYDKVGYF